MWDFCKLKNHLDTLGEKREHYAEYIESVSRTIDIYEFHKCEAFELLTKLEPDTPQEKMRLVFATGIERNKLEHSVIAVQAHLHAALHNARSMYDIFAQLLNALLIVEPKPIHKCHIQDVCAALPNSELKVALDKLLESYEYKYVSGFVNIIKHRNLVQCATELDLAEDKASIRVKHFYYAKSFYDQEWALNALSYSLAVKNNLIDLGLLLNRECGVV